MIHNIIVAIIGVWISLGILLGSSFAYFCWSNGHGVIRIILAFIVAFFTWPIWLFI